MLGTACLVYHKCYTLCMLGLSKVRNTSWSNALYGGNKASTCICAATPPHMDWIYWFSKNMLCTAFELLTYRLMLTDYFTNNL